MNRNLNRRIHPIAEADGLSPKKPRKETIEEFKQGLSILRKAYIYAQRIDWLLSGDDGEESFHKRLKEELDNLKNKKNESTRIN